MKIVIPGGSGHVGTLLAQALHGDGHEIVVLSRQPGAAAASPWRTVTWDAETQGDWATEIDGADVVINLAGRSVNCRYTPANRKAILHSRVASTRAVGEAIARAARPPAVWLQMSTATIYAHRYDAPNDDLTGILGGSEPRAPDTWRFSIEVATAWEQALNDAATPKTRKVAMRTAIVMSPEPGGVFDVLLGLVRRGLGGRSAHGLQYVSWIYEQDFVRAVRWLIAQETLSGAVNLASPNPLTNAAFMRALRTAWGARFGIGAPKLLVEVGAVVLGTETELILKSRRVVPARLLQSGFKFHYPRWPEAASDLCKRWRELHGRVPSK